LGNTAVQTALASLLLLGACAPDGADDAAVQVAHLRHVDGHVSATLSIVDDAGEPVPKSSPTQVTVKTRAGAGAWQVAGPVVLSNAPPLLDVMLVADNSGSAADEITEVQDAIRQFAHVILTRAHDDRMGMIRVSTVATVLQDPTPLEAPIEAAIDGMFVSNGWTALWDGVRLGNERLAASRIDASGENAPVGGGACYVGTVPSLVVYTDGHDNNSADEHPTSYEGDGVDTTLDDLMALSVDGVQTAIYTVAISDDADATSLEALADATGGRHVSIQNDGQLIGALHGAAAQLDSLFPFCFVPASCSHTEAELRVRVKHGNQWTTYVRLVALTPSC
jgi:hypothetical protein